MFPSERALLSEGCAAVLKAWATHALVGIDLSERHHATMRRELHSETGARSFTRSSKFALCQTVKHSHAAGGGADPARFDVATAVPALQGTTAPQVRRRPSSATSAYPACRNHK